jgi:hypothetical protein
MAKQSAAPKGQTLTKEFEFQLTMRELAERAKSMAGLSGEAHSLEIELKQFVAKKNQEIKERYAELDKIALAVREGKETRMVDAVMTKDFASNVVQFWHANEDGIWDVIEERALTEEEKQMHLDDVAPKRRGKPKAVPEKPLANGETEIDEVRKSETKRTSKRSAVDGVYS